MPESKNRLRRRVYKKKRIDFDSIRWGNVLLALAGCVVVVVGAVFGLRALFSTLTKPKADPAPSAGGAQILSSPSLATSQPVDLAPSQPEGSLESPLDLSLEVQKVVSQEENVNIPDIHGKEMVYSAGTGSLREPLLKTLYLYNFETGTETKVADVQLDKGEIFQTVVNEDYIAWLDTDQRGSNRIYCLNRNEENAEPKLIKSCKFAVPKLRLSIDFLIWIEQNEDKEERLYIVDLISEENASIPGFIESVEKAMSTYGVSAPGIYNTQVVWAASDPNQSDEDRILNGEKSAIYSCDLSRFIEDDYAPSAFSPGMYVHDPITNGEVWAWIDKNKAPDSSLYIKLEDDQVLKVADNVITYALGDEMLVFGKDENIYVYFYKTNQYGRANAEGTKGIMPVVSGRRIVWFDKTESGGKDQLVTVVVPYETAGD